VNENTGRVIALGFFDGVHAGHASLLNMAKQRAAEKNLEAAVMSFDLHPDNLVAGAAVSLINSVEDRMEILERIYGIGDVILCHFDETMMHMPWDRFLEEFLVEQHGAGHLVCGYDFHFGDKGYGTPERLQEKCRELGVGCDIMPRFTMDGVTVSSTYIRGLLEQGHMEEAMRFLGHPHCISGPVVHGKQLGRTIGIPTANLLIPQGVLVPAFGVYATKVVLPDGQEKLAVTNVGVRPTVGESQLVTVEPWILDYSGDLYGQHIRVDFYQRLRGEKKFAGLPELQREILRNAQETRSLLAKTN
jgi:riboflavin kinase/FMN adenylyltransferase